MKRNNPDTGKPFTKGAKREDGWVFNCYLKTKDEAGQYRELWILPPTKEPRTKKPKNHARDTLRGRLRSLISNARCHAKQRNHDQPDVTADDLFELWSEQRGLCAYTGWPMTTQTGSKFVVSLERIDSTRSYTRDNVVLICWAANAAKGKMTHAEFVQLCCAVTIKANQFDELATL